MKHTLLIITALMLVVGWSSGQEPEKNPLEWSLWKAAPSRWGATAATMMKCPYTA